MDDICIVDQRKQTLFINLPRLLYWQNRLFFNI